MCLGKVLCTPERARTIVIIVCFVTAIITAPEFFESRALWKTQPDNTTQLIIETTKFAYVVLSNNLHIENMSTFYCQLLCVFGIFYI